MVLASPGASCSASGIATYMDCAARYWHDRQRYDWGMLPTDPVPAGVGLAVHDALMTFHRQAQQRLRLGRALPLSEGQRQLSVLVDQQLARRRLIRQAPPVAARLEKLADGMDGALRLMLDDLPRWAVDARTQDLLVWEELPLDHGPSVPAVELTPGVLVRTRPDVIGLRPVGNTHRIVVRDFKTRSDAVDPMFDVGTLVRGIWALFEAQEPRCRKFLLGRSLQIDTSGIDLEVVNLGHAEPDFVIRASPSEAQLRERRDWLVGMIEAMVETEALRSADDVVASPGGLCLSWCPHLNRCVEGRRHVRKFYDEEQLRARLAGAQEL
jgi:hypothetical protein